MAALAADLDFGFDHRVAAPWASAAARTALVSAALLLLATAGVAIALFLPRSASAPVGVSLSPAATVVAPQGSAGH
jgi:hypothetical protein